MQGRVVVVGSLNMDLVSRCERIPAPGETVLGGDLETVPGGKGANQAVAAARAGAITAMVGNVGNDLFAEQLRDNLIGDGIDCSYVNSTDVASGVALIVVDGAGQNSIVVASGANAQVTPAQVEAAAALIEDADVLVLQLEIPLESVQRAARIAADAGVTVVLNPAPAQPLPDALLRLVDILVPNESETALLSGQRVDSAQEAEAAAQKLRAGGVETVVLTLGERGALLAGAQGIRRFAAHRVEHVVDTTAAGDAFVGALAATLAAGASIAEAVETGTIAGALAVTKAGAQPSLPTRAEIEAVRAAGD